MIEQINLNYALSQMFLGKITNNILHISYSYSKDKVIMFIYLRENIENIDELEIEISRQMNEKFSTINFFIFTDNLTIKQFNEGDFIKLKRILFQRATI